MIESQMHLLCKVTSELFSAAERSVKANKVFMPDVEEMIQVEKSAAERLTVDVRPSYNNMIRCIVEDPGVEHAQLRAQARRTVNLSLEVDFASDERSTCTCEHPKQFGVVCKHIIAACKHFNQWEGDVSKFDEWLFRECDDRLRAKNVLRAVTKYMIENAERDKCKVIDEESSDYCSPPVPGNTRPRGRPAVNAWKRAQRAKKRRTGSVLSGSCAPDEHVSVMFVIYI